MGQMRFRIQDRDRIAEEDLSQIYMAGAEEIPWSTHAQWVDDELVVERQVGDSGNVYVPWQLEGVGARVLNTATLMERERPYQLEVELARGLIQRIRNRLFIWEWLGLNAAPEPQDQLRQATREFSLAATTQHEPAEASVAANRAIALAFEASESLVASYAEQVLSAQQRQTPASTLLGVCLNAETPNVEVRRRLVEACNIVELPIAWRSIEQREGKRDWKSTDAQLAWAQQSGLKVAAGPLLRLDDAGMPDWMVLWEGDFENLARLMLEHVRAVVARYAGRVHLWHVSSRVNTGRLLSLEEEQRLHLVAQTLDLVRQLDPRTPTVVSFDQPWGEYLARQDDNLAPLHFADALVRADLGISGFGLEINAGYFPGGSCHRPTLELGRLLDQWSIWGLPLMMKLSTPSSIATNTNAKSNVRVNLASTEAEDPQCEWAGAVLPLLLSRNTVQVILWNQLDDSRPHEFPNGGLFSAQQIAKPTLELMRDLRKSCLL